ncbi:hypothetical protein D8780_11655 [Notoacmeibacter ruber]|uniref:Uncharacterized protein n=1 Tax=Notoacmeibacter ruber TaxID=2670375 RepID=A0A3L7JE73_9HYPH|nr:hypothetical protein D8780_11655 [Notoacmeibacter ruber]
MARTGKTFLLVNLFGVPALSFIARLMGLGADFGGVPQFSMMVFFIALGVGVIGYNAWLTWRGKRAAGWAPAVIGMAIWTLACALTLFFFRAFSPISLALAYGGLY